MLLNWLEKSFINHFRFAIILTNSSKKHNAASKQQLLLMKIRPSFWNFVNELCSIEIMQPIIRKKNECI